jgi:hypothetical protein
MIKAIKKLFGKKPEPVTPEEKVVAALEALPKTIPAISEYFLSLGIQGVRKSPTHCPVAQYLETTTGEKVMVLTNIVEMGKPSDSPSNPADCTIPIPPHITSFIIEFDRIFTDLPLALYK